MGLLWVSDSSQVISNIMDGISYQTETASANITAENFLPSNSFTFTFTMQWSRNNFNWITKLRSYFGENSIKSLEISNLVTLSLKYLAIKYAADGRLDGEIVKLL